MHAGGDLETFKQWGPHLLEIEAGLAQRWFVQKKYDLVYLQAVEQDRDVLTGSGDGFIGGIATHNKGGRADTLDLDGIISFGLLLERFETTHVTGIFYVVHHGVAEQGQLGEKGDIMTETVGDSLVHVIKG